MLAAGGGRRAAGGGRRGTEAGKEARTLGMLISSRAASRGFSVSRFPFPVSRFPPLGTPPLVGGRAVDRWDGDVDEPQVDGELAAMMDKVIDGRPDRRPSRAGEQHAVAVLERPRHATSASFNPAIAERASATSLSNVARSDSVLCRL